jgi:hypothetical protein
VLLTPEAGKAQQRAGVVRFSPVVGISLPFGGAFIDERLLHKQQVTSAILSARLDYTATTRLGVETSISAGRGLVAVRDSTNAVHDISGTIFLSNLKGVLWINPGVRNGIIMHVASGIGLIGRSGKVWQDTKPKGISPAWVVAVGGNAKLTPRGPVEFRFELEDYVSQAQFNVGLPTETRALLHHDIVWSLGLSFPIMGRWK